MKPNKTTTFMNKSFIGRYFKTEKLAKEWVRRKNKDEYLRKIGYAILQFNNGFFVVGGRQAKLLK